MSFTVNGHEYTSGKLNAKQQFHIVRRLAPVLSGLVGIKDAEDAIGSITNAISSLSDTDADFVLFGLLSCVERQDASGGWAKITAGELLMYQDIDLMAMMQIAVESFKVNFGNFFNGFGSILTDTNLKVSDQ
jgi:hypothetical protein